MGLWETINFGCIALILTILSVVFLRKQKWIMSICLGVFVIPFVCLSGYNWRLALIDSGKDPTWLGFRQYPVAVIILIFLVAIALFSTLFSILQKNREKA